MANPLNAFGAGGENRTRTGLPPLDFESSASTCSTTPAHTTQLTNDLGPVKGNWANNHFPKI